jgi:hypothetical protein
MLRHLLYSTVPARIFIKGNGMQRVTRDDAVEVPRWSSRTLHVSLEILCLSMMTLSLPRRRIIAGM